MIPEPFLSLVWSNTMVNMAFTLEMGGFGMSPRP